MCVIYMLVHIYTIYIFHCDSVLARIVCLHLVVWLWWRDYSSHEVNGDYYILMYIYHHHAIGEVCEKRCVHIYSIFMSILIVFCVQCCVSLLRAGGRLVCVVWMFCFARRRNTCSQNRMRSRSRVANCCGAGLTVQVVLGGVWGLLWWVVFLCYRQVYYHYYMRSSTLPSSSSVFSCVRIIQSSVSFVRNNSCVQRERRAREWMTPLCS